jgi:hypothetical protein
VTDGSDVLVIEDIRVFNFPCVYARNAYEAEPLLFGRAWREVWFDHDLGLLKSSPDVMPLVNKMERLAHEGTILPIGRIYVHTANPVGRANIVAALSPWYEVRVVDANVYLAPGEKPMYWMGDR